MSSEKLEVLKRTGLRWGILKCLHEAICNARLDVPGFINRDLEVARSIIETGCRKVEDADSLLDWVESKLMEKAISLNNIDYWEDLLKRARKDKLTLKEVLNVPFMKQVSQKYDFLSYCMPEYAKPARENKFKKEKALAIP